MGFAPGCVPWWYNETCAPNCKCPHGIMLPGDITIPDHMNVVRWLAVVYSVLPALIIALNVLEVLLKRSTRQLSFLLFTGFIIGCNELVIKKMLEEARPGATGLLTDKDGYKVGSCCIKCGMPSSHAAMSVGFLLVMLFDGVYRVVPSKEELTVGVETRHFVDCHHSWLSFTPLSPKAVMTHSEFIRFFLVWFILLMPVPFMRVVLYDHSADQVILGCTLGGVYSLFWLAFTNWMVRLTSPYLGDHGWIVHDYRPPEFRVQVEENGRKKLLREAEIVEANLDDVRTGRVSRLESGDGVELQNDPRELARNASSYRTTRAGQADAGQADAVELQNDPRELARNAVA